MEKIMLAALLLFGCDYLDTEVMIRAALDDETHCYVGSVCTTNERGLITLHNWDCIVGDVNLNDPTQEEVAAVSHLRRIEGTLNISHTTDIVEINMPHLEYVGDIIDVFNNDILEVISFPTLQRSKKMIIQSNPLLEIIDAPELSKIAENLIVTDCAALATDEICAVRNGLDDWVTFQTDIGRTCENEIL